VGKLLHIQTIHCLQVLIIHGTGGGYGQHLQIGQLAIQIPENRSMAHLQMLHLVTHESQKVLQLAALAQISQLNPLEAQVAVLSLGMLVDCLQIMLRHYHLALLHEATSMDQIPASPGYHAELLQIVVGEIGHDL